MGPGEASRVNNINKIINGNQTGSASKIQVTSRAYFQPGLDMLAFAVRIMGCRCNPRLTETLPKIRAQNVL